jgi:predicted permease
MTETSMQTIRHAIRRLLRARAFTAAALLTLTLGIGATTAVFTVVNAVLLQPLPYPDPERLVDLSHTLTISGITRVDQSDATFLYYRRENRSFADVGAYRVTGVNVGRLTGSSGPADTRAERVNAGLVSASTFTVLRAKPLAGRAFRDDEDRPDAPLVALIGQRLWERKFGADPALVGRRLEIDGVPREVVGIMPATFDLPASRTDVWLPLRLDPSHTASAAFDYRGIARLRPGVSLEAASADLQRLLPHVPEAFPGRLTTQAITQIQMRAVIRPLRDTIVGDVGRVLWVVLGAVACVLLVACANVMNLFLVRAEGRQHELAVRRALGAGRRTLAWEHVAEGAILAVIGGVLAIAVAGVGVRVLRSLEGAIAIPRLGEVRVDGTVLAVATGVTTLALLLVSVLPAARASGTVASTALREMGRALTAGRARHRARNALVVSQLALAVVLLAGAGLMARSFARLRAVPAGMDAERAFAFRVALPRVVYGDSGAAARFIVRALDAIGSVQGVETAAAISKLPLVPDARQDSALFVEDHPLAPGSMPAIHQMAFTSPGYFRALGIPMLDGRTFESLDPARAPREVVLSRSVAARYWPKDRAVGKRVRMSPVGEWYTVVGVAGDVRGSGLDQPPDEIVYLPMVVTLGGMAMGQDPPRAWTPRDVAFVTRAERDTALVGARAEAIVRALDPEVPAYGARVMADVVSQSMARTTVTLILLGVASAVALALGAIGIFGVVSYVVSLRTREIAVRMALGARPVDVRRMVTRQVAVVAAAGVGVGIAGALAVTRVLGALLFGVSPVDPASLAAAAVGLGVVAFLASWVPARRASGTDPAQALRAD